MQDKCIEEKRCLKYVEQSSGEIPFEKWLGTQQKCPGLITVEGFEERSFGVLKRFSMENVHLPGVVIARYENSEDMNVLFRPQFEKLARSVSEARVSTVYINKEGSWVEKAMQLLGVGEVIIDITGLSKRLLFGVLDYAVESDKQVLIGYSEAGEYWPKLSDWEQVFAEFAEQDIENLSKVFDEKPWLYSYENRVELISKHEGYDVAGNKRALIGFLTFKCARLAAILMKEDYSKYKFIAGIPRLRKNKWRCDVQKKVNATIIGHWPIIELSTFGYRQTILKMSSLLFSEDRLLEEFNVCMAPLGSKLQTIGCWAISHICKSITVVTSIPAGYFTKAFSNGVGESWVFPLKKP